MFVRVCRFHIILVKRPSTELCDHRLGCTETLPGPLRVSRTSTGPPPTASKGRTYDVSFVPRKYTVIPVVCRRSSHSSPLSGFQASTRPSWWYLVLHKSKSFFFFTGSLQSTFLHLVSRWALLLLPDPELVPPTEGQTRSLTYSLPGPEDLKSPTRSPESSG